MTGVYSFGSCDGAFVNLSSVEYGDYEQFGRL